MKKKHIKQVTKTEIEEYTAEEIAAIEETSGKESRQIARLKDVLRYVAKNYQEPIALKAHYMRGGLGDVKVKKFLNNVIQDELRPIRERRKEIAKDIPAVYKILEEGSIKAEKKAAQTLAEMKRAMKINYFEDKELIAEQAARFSSEADA